jgi:hypothetical protein
LSTITTSFTFVDNVIVIAILVHSSISNTQLAANQSVQWSHLGFMRINTKKTKEMFVPVQNKLLALIRLDSDRAASFKLLSVTTANNLSKDEHVYAISAIATKRLQFFAEKN